jgi:hypothetical protein
MMRSSPQIPPPSSARRVSRCSYRSVASFAGVALILLFAASASASADLLEEAVTTVDSLPSSATETIPAPPPPAPLVPPAPPPVHVSVPAPSTLDSSVPPTPPPIEPTSSVASASSHLVNGLAGSASELAEGAGSIGSDSVQAPPGRPAAAHPSGPGGPGPTSRTGEHRSVRPPQPARARPLLTYVWPAIALGPFGRLLSALEPRLRAVTSLAPGGALRLRSGLFDGRGSPPERSAASAPPQADSPPLSLPGTAAISLLVLLITSAAMVALLVFAVRFELGLVDHRRPR